MSTTSENPHSHRLPRIALLFGGYIEVSAAFHTSACLMIFSFPGSFSSPSFLRTTVVMRMLILASPDRGNEEAKIAFERYSEHFYRIDAPRQETRVTLFRVAVN